MTGLSLLINQVISQQTSERSTQSPSALVSMPEQRHQRNNEIALSFTDFSDTLKVKVFYDTDNKHFDGVLIQEFEALNNSEISFVWDNSDVPDGEYYIYSRISDGENPPTLQYAPGSILVDNINIETPQSVSVALANDAIHVSWDAPIDGSIIVTEIRLKDVSTNQEYFSCVTDTTAAYVDDVPSRTGICSRLQIR